MMGKIKYLLLAITLTAVFLSLLIKFIYNPFGDLTIKVNQTGLYHIKLYDVIDDETIDYGSKYALNGNIKINTKKLHDVDEFERHFVVIVENNDHVGIGNYTYINQTFKKDSQIHKILINNYQKHYSNKIDIHFIEKDSEDTFEIAPLDQISIDVKVHLNKRECATISEGAMLLNTMISTGEEIGPMYLTQNFGIIGYGISYTLVNQWLSQNFTYKELLFSNDEQQFQLLVIFQYNSGSARDEFPEYAYTPYVFHGNEFKIILDWYPVDEDIYQECSPLEYLYQYTIIEYNENHEKLLVSTIELNFDDNQDFSYDLHEDTTEIQLIKHYLSNNNEPYEKRIILTREQLNILDDVVNNEKGNLVIYLLKFSEE